MIRVLAFIMAVSATPVFAQEATGPITIEAPWARASIGTGRPGAAYLTITNTGSEPDFLVGIESPQAEMPMLHETTVSADGVARMEHVDRLEIPPGESVALEPRGRHIMLMELTEPLVEGEALTLELVFEKAGPVEVAAPILGIAAQGLTDE